MGPARKNNVTFGLVNAPVGVVSAKKSDSNASFKMVAPYDRDEDGALPGRASKVDQRYMDPSAVRTVTVDDEPVQVVYLSDLYTKADLDGYRAVERGTDPTSGETVYQPIDVEAFEEAAEKLEGVEVVGFVPEADLAPYLERTYDAHYLQPQGGAPAKPLALLARGMVGPRKGDRVAAVAKFTVGGLQRVGVLRVRDDGTLVLLSLRFAAKWKTPDAEVRAVTEVELDKKLVEQARALVADMTIDVSIIDDLRDTTADRRAELMEQVMSGSVPEGAPQVAGPEPDLMAALEASIAATKDSKKRAVTA